MPRISPPPRLFVIFARDVHEAVIFRRGPAAWYHIVRWNTSNDTFFSGAWFKGRIYPEKCDLSPDGKLLLYFVHKGSRLSTSYTDAWTAISRSPWMEAIGLWPQGTTYGGGGRFTDNNSVLLRTFPKSAHPDHPATSLSIAFGNAPLHASSYEVEGSEWSGRDQGGRLIYTQDGRLMCNKGKNLVCLADFNGYTPHPESAPPFAGTQVNARKKSSKKKSKPA